MNWSNRKKLAFCVIGLALAYCIAWVSEERFQEECSTTWFSEQAEILKQNRGE